MVSLNQIAFNITENMGDNSDVFIRRMKFTVLYYRAMMIRRDYSNNGHLPETLLQELVFDTAPVVYHKDRFNRTTTKPPIPIRIKGPVFHYVGGIDRKTPYRFMYPEEMEYHNYNKWNCKIPGYSYIDGYITVHNISSTKIMVRGVFEDPVEVGKLMGDGCVDDNAPFPIPLDMVEAITKGILSGELSVRDQNADVADEVKM